MNSPANHLSAVLAADERGESPVGQPSRCCYCGNAYSPKTGQIVERPFVWINVTDGVCKLCYPQRLAAAKQAARAMR